MRSFISLFLLFFCMTAAFPNEALHKTDIKTITCPSPETLKKQNLFWQAPGGFKSHSQSLIREIDHFLGAHWIGAGYGKIICSYGGKSTNTFPLNLHNSSFVQKPRGQHWSDEHNGVMACFESSPQKCPFVTFKISDSGLNFKSLESLKTTPIDD